VAERFVDIGGIVKHHCLNEDLDSRHSIFVYNICIS